MFATWGKQAKWGVFLGVLGALWIGVMAAGCTCDPTAPSFLGKIATDLPNHRLIFTNAEVGKATERDFRVYNDGNIDISLTSFRIVGDEKKAFTLINAPQEKTVLKPGSSAGITLKVKFLANESGSFSARIEISSPDADNIDTSGNFYIDLRNQVLAPDVRFACGRQLDFGAVDKGQTKTMNCEISNAGSAAFVIRGAKYVAEKGSKEDFKWTSPDKFPVEIPSGGGKLEIKITYAPSDYPPAEDQGVFELDSNSDVTQKLRVVGVTAVPLVTLVPMYGTCASDGECKNKDRRLSCTQDAASNQNLCLPREDVTPFLIFPLTSKGKTTKRTFVIRSTGERPLKVEQIELDATSSGDFKVITQGLQLPFTLESKQEKEITVEYTPSDDKEDAGQVVVTSNAGNKGKATILLEAASRGCNLEVNPRTHLFRAPKPPLTVNLINVGNESCTLKKVSLKSGNSVFALLPTPAPNQTIVPNGRIDFLINFTPPDNREYKDAVVIESTDPDEPTIELELVGKVDGKEECEIKANPNRLLFGLVGVGRSKKLTVAVSNEGWGDCTLSAINVVGTLPGGNNAFQLASKVQAPLVISSGSNVRLEVAYTPPQETNYEGKLTLQSNDKNTPNLDIQLVGSSGTLCLEVVPATMDFGSSKFGCSTPTRKIQVFNLGGGKCTGPINITKIALAQGTTPEFRIMSAPPVPKSVAIGENIEVGMSYKPTAIGVDTGILEIDNSQSPVTIPLVGEGVNTDDQKDVFKQLQRPLTDILFVVDDSCSMSDKQTNLANNFQSFINWAVRLNVDYQIMITTTDTDSSSQPFGGPGCARGNPKIITPQTPDPIGKFQVNVKVGINGSGLEKGLEAGYRALIPPASTGCNKGFYREAASLSMIFVSDEVDQSPQQVQFYISFFKTLKGFRNIDLIRASVVVGPPPNGCRGTGGTGSAQGDVRYWEVAKELKGVQESICSQNWAATLSNIGSITFGYRTQFFLSRQADPKTITVKVNGSDVKEDPQDGWQYDATNNSVNFSKTQIPPPGATVQVDYKAICLP